MLTQTRLRVRKVKCDEEKPRCRRCTSTGRKCDGYAPELPAGVLLPRPGYFQNGPVDPKERRALQFFCEASGPFLSGPLDSYFWTHLVMQFSYFESRHLEILKMIVVQFSGPVVQSDFTEINEC